MTLRSMLARLLGLFRARRLDHELNAELQSHIEMAVEENVRGGMNPEEARRRAARSFGPVEPMKEEYRDTRGVPIVESVLQCACGRQPANYLGSAQQTRKQSPGVSDIGDCCSMI